MLEYDYSHILTFSTSFYVPRRKIDMHGDVIALMKTVIPHEIAHVTIAGECGQKPPPRWLDEGIAMLTENEETQQAQIARLPEFDRSGTLFGARALLAVRSYSDQPQLLPFYAQSLSWTKYLETQKGPRTVVDFARDGEHRKGGYPEAARKYYDKTLEELEEDWRKIALSKN